MAFTVCNEFFDALPIHQFELDSTSKKWHEVLIDVDLADDPAEDSSVDETLRFVLAPGETPATRALLPLFEESDLEGKRRIEVSPGVLYHAQKICDRIIHQGGSALIIDYGHEGEKEDTFRAFKDHALVRYSKRL